MPAAKPPLPIETPAPINGDEAAFIKETVKRFYGSDAVVRTYGPDPAHLELYVEVSGEPGMERFDCAGVLYAKLDRQSISLEVVNRTAKRTGSAKIACRQGLIL
jgi:hypothetical protein